jgi:hypothetical protein
MTSKRGPALSAPLPAVPAIVPLIVLGLLVVLLFARLGQYALWDDECMVGLVAKGVERTGDTSVFVGDGNIVAYRGGILIHNGCDRSTPPLSTYLAAAAFGIFGVGTWSARFFFALLGVGTYALILQGARRLPWPAFFTLAIGLLANVSLLLNLRQCRYYAPAIFFTTAVAFVYTRWTPRPRHLLLLAVLSVLLFAANYMMYVVVYACLALDYLIWKRREWQLDWRGFAWWFGPQVVGNGALACVWNPFLTQETTLGHGNTLGDRFVLVYRFWRDANVGELFPLALVIVALIVGLVQRREWLVRTCLALGVYVTLVALVAPQPVATTTFADIRYLGPAIPLAIILEAGTLTALCARLPILAPLLALVVFGSNLIDGGPLLPQGLRSTTYAFIGELYHPPPEPFTPTAAWINANVPPGASVWVEPDYMTYPLMFLAPKALYAWQLDWPPRADFANLPEIHFMGRKAPDYLIGFGPGVGAIGQELSQTYLPDAHYENVAVIPVFWKDAYRPEIFLRTFEPITGFNPNRDCVYIFRRTGLTTPAKP